MKPSLCCLAFSLLFTSSGGAWSVDAPQALRIRDAVKAIPEGVVVDVQENGIPRTVRGRFAGVAAISEAGLAPALPRVARALDLTAADLKWYDVRKDKDGSSRVRYHQWHDGLEVVGASVTVLVRKNGELQRTVAETATGLPDSKVLVPALAAQAEALKEYAALGTTTDAGRLVYVIATTDQSVHLAWVFAIAGVREGEIENDMVFISAKTGGFVDRHPQFIKALYRQISAGGIVKRTEGGSASTDAFVNTNYAHLGTAHGFYQSILGRDSFDNAGGALISNVRDTTSGAYNNAYWSLTYHNFHFGNSDGTTFSNMVGALDVTAHELGHGVTQYESNLTYSNESGAINECMSDVFGAGCEKRRDGSVTANTWKIGEEIYTPSYGGDALRYMNDPVADGNSVDYWPNRKYIGTPTDNGGVHYNSGIGNLAFVLMANGGTHPRGRTSVSVPAIGFDVALQIFYHANCNYLGASSNFAALRSATASSANDLYGAVVADKVHTAWDAVGVPGSHPPLLPVVSVGTTAGSDWCTEYLTRTGTFTVSRPSTNTTNSVNVYYTYTGTLTKGTHFTSSPDAMVVLDPGQASKVITITPLITAGYEAPATIQVNLSANPSYAIGTGSATMSRHDQDLQLTGAILARTYPGSAIPFNYRQVRLVNTASVPSGVVTINAQDTIVLASGTSATTTVASDATLNLTAKNLISMLPGTTISQGASFSARIQ